MKKKISVVIPAYNEEANLEELHRRLSGVFGQVHKYDFEVILVDNGSVDGTWPKVRAIAATDKRFKSVRLSRNFTAPGGITAGLKYARGDAAIVMCADLQDTPEKIPTLIAKWEEGYDVVYQLVTKREGVTFLRELASNIFHSLMTRLTNNAFPKNGSVYRLMDRVAYEAFNDLNETNRYFTGLCNWIGFKSVGVEFPRAERFAGEAKSPFRVVLRLALNGIFAFSYVPLKLMTYFGVLTASGAVLYFLWLVGTITIYGRQTVPGIATQTALTVLLFGGLFLSLGVIGEYLARIYDEVKGRPNFIVKQAIGFETNGVYRGTYRDGAIFLADPSARFNGQDTVTIQLS